MVITAQRLHAFTINPLVPGGVMAKTLLDELLIAHKAHLPNFADAINKIEETQPETVTYVAELMKSIKKYRTLKICLVCDTF